MKFIHISDLHLGKRVNEFSMMEEQKYILQQVLDTVQNEAADAVLIAGSIACGVVLGWLVMHGLGVAV